MPESASDLPRPNGTVTYERPLDQAVPASVWRAILADDEPVTAADELIVDAWALRDNLTVADAVYVVLARRSGAALMSIDERMLRAAGLDDIPFFRP